MKMFPVVLVVLMFSCSKKGDNPGGGSTQQPSASVSAAPQPEGNSGTSNYAVAFNLSNAFSSVVTVHYSTVAGTAKAGEDFTAVSNAPVTFQPGETQKTIHITVVADDVREGDDAFTIMITGTTNASIGSQFMAAATIVNDDLRVPFTNTGYDAPTSYAGYTLVWADEFNNGTLDGNAWTVEGGDGCPSLCGWGNNELEYYTGRPENLFFQDGKLLIEARPEIYNGRNYTSSKILTRGKKTFKYGRVDIRAKLPRGKGVWPALWMLPQNNVYGGWPSSGEIDIMELVGHEPHKCYATLHYGPGPGSTSINRGYTLGGGATFNDEFHVFSMEWKMDQIKIFVDNILYSTVNKTDIGSMTWPFNEEFFFIFNVAVGGNWPGSPDGTTNFPQWMVVDYIRVYQ